MADISEDDIIPLKYLRSAEVLSLQPGDMIVLTVRDHVTDDAYAQLTETLARQLEPLGDHPVLILERGATIGVVRKDSEG